VWGSGKELEANDDCVGGGYYSHALRPITVCIALIGIARSDVALGSADSIDRRNTF